jgi:hypothetical protein
MLLEVLGDRGRSHDCPLIGARFEGLKSEVLTAPADGHGSVEETDVDARSAQPCREHDVGKLIDLALDLKRQIFTNDSLMSHDENLIEWKVVRASKDVVAAGRFDGETPVVVCDELRQVVVGCVDGIDVS